jgi:predicted enzyme related to lactoylglutathione lyase
MTPDVAKSLQFYSQLFGWTANEIDMGSFGTYTMLHQGEKPIGGMAPLGADEGDSAYWLSYVSVPDVDEAAGKAEAKGGNVIVPPSDIPDTGRFSIVKDPSGALIAPFKGTEPSSEPSGPPGVGSFCWNELTTADATAAQAFYSDLFGWTVASMDLGEMGPYWLFKRGEQDTAGMSQSSEQPSSWLPYVAVDSVDDSAAKAEGLGGAIFVPPTDIPHIGRFAILGDPTGGSIGLFKGAA